MYEGNGIFSGILFNIIDSFSTFPFNLNEFWYVCPNQIMLYYLQNKPFSTFIMYVGKSYNA